MLTLRALRCNGDLADHWRFHLSRQRQCVHQARSINYVIPRAA